MQRLVEQRLNKRQKMKLSSCLTVNHQVLRMKGKKKLSQFIVSHRDNKKADRLQTTKMPRL